MPTVYGLPATPQPLDRILALVNEGFISSVQVDTKMAAIQKQYPQASFPPPEVFKKQILDILIQEKIILDYAEKTNMHLSPHFMDEEIKRLASAQNLSVPEFMGQIEAQGIALSDFKKELRKEATIQYTQQRDILPTIQIRDEQIDYTIDYAKKHKKKHNPAAYHLRHILISLPENPTPQERKEAEEKAHQVIHSVKNGMDFAQAARAYSQDSLALSGGDLGLRPIEQIPSLFTEILPTLSVTDIYGPILSNSGFHIIQLVDLRYDPKVLPPSLSKEQVQQWLMQQAYEEKIPGWQHQLRSNAYVKILSEPS